MTYRPLRSFCETQAQHSRIINALWKSVSFYPSQMPEQWEPNPMGVRDMRLNAIGGLGPVTLEIIDRWLEANRAFY